MAQHRQTRGSATNGFEASLALNGLTLPFHERQVSFRYRQATEFSVQPGDYVRLVSAWRVRHLSHLASALAAPLIIAMEVHDASACELSRDYFRKQPLSTYCAAAYSEPPRKFLPPARTLPPVRKGRTPPPPVETDLPTSLVLASDDNIRAEGSSSSARQAQAALTDQSRNNPFSDWRLMPRSPSSPYTIEELSKDAYAIRWELAIVGGGLVAYGFKQWGWGSARFKFQNEGFFGQDTQYGGMDKLGHAFSTYLLSDFFYARLSRHFGPSDNVALSASLMSFGAMFMVEVFDGIAENHGFSYEDIVADAAGATFSYLRNTIPGLRDKLDYRLQYLPSGTTVDPFGDYMGQKYLLALKLSGFEKTQRTPFRFVELHAGYFARGYSDLDKQIGAPKERYLYAGLGLNLNEILFSNPSVRGTVPGSAASLMLEYFQVPYTSINTNNKR